MSKSYVRDALNKLMNRFYDESDKKNDFQRVSRLYCYLEKELENEALSFKRGELVFIGGNYSFLNIKRENNPIVIEIPFNIKNIRMEEQCNLSLSLKRIAKASNIPVLVLIKYTDVTTMLDSIKYGPFMQDSDQIVFMTNDDVKIIKNRNGKTGNMAWNDYIKENKCYE